MGYDKYDRGEKIVRGQYQRAGGIGKDSGTSRFGKDQARGRAGSLEKTKSPGLVVPGFSIVIVGAEAICRF